MDPLTALGLAANIAQFVDFGTKLFFQAKEIHDKGSSISIAHIRNVTTDLVSINASLREQLQANSAQNVHLTKEERELDKLTINCMKEAQDLVTCLNKIAGHRSSKSKTWKSFREAFETVWSKNHIDEVAIRLSRYREQIALRILVVLNAQQRQQTEQLGLLQESNKEIVEVLAINQSIFKAIIQNGQIQRDYLRKEDQDLASRRHDETIAAILTCRNGDTQTIRYSSPPNLSPSLHHNGEIHGGRRATSFTQGATDTLTSAVVRKANFKSNDYSDIQAAVVASLYFRAITDRSDVVSEAYKKTFEWIYRDPSKHQKPWSNFSEWLVKGQDVYWINGKAGSGKSTLMKYIQEDSRTQAALLKWAAKAHLVRASFYFWNAGSPLQRSQAGLLRSLLHGILSQRQDLVPILFPRLCCLASTHLDSKFLEVSSTELNQAFMNLINHDLGRIKICLFIDGIDEYDGEHRDLSELFLLAASSPSIKIVLSSRPIPACVQTFSKCPKLRLQDLTHDDIVIYVEDKLGSHPLMQNLDVIQDGASLQLTNEITSKASGVFLWVILVTKSLLDGLQNYDRIEDLLHRLESLPADLEKFYRHMLASMEADYRRQASKILQLVLKSFKIQHDLPMSVLQLSFAEMEDYSASIRARVQQLPERQIKSRCIATEGRLRSRCCGLIEVQELRHQSTGNERGEGSVRFLHRTVIEFLQTPSVWKELLSLTQGSQFDADKALISSSLSEMKCLSPDRRVNGGMSRSWINMRQILAYAESFEQSEDASHHIYLDEMRKTMDVLCPNDDWASYEASLNGFDDTKIRFISSFSFLIACNKISSYFREELALNCPGVRERNVYLAHLLWHYLKSHRTKSNSSAVYKLNLATSIILVLECGADANSNVEINDSAWFFRGRSSNEWVPWHFFMTHLLAFVNDNQLSNVSGRKSDYELLDQALYLKLVNAFLLAGANPHRNITTEFPVVTRGGAVTYRELPASTIIQQLYVTTQNVVQEYSPDQVAELSFLCEDYERIMQRPKSPLGKTRRDRVNHSPAGAHDSGRKAGATTILGMGTSDNTSQVKMPRNRHFNLCGILQCFNSVEE